MLKEWGVSLVMLLLPLRLLHYPRKGRARLHHLVPAQVERFENFRRLSRIIALKETKGRYGNRAPALRLRIVPPGNTANAA